MKNCLALLILLLSGLSLNAQEKSDRDQITETVNWYFEGMMERNLEKLERAFLPEARLIGYRGENLTITDFKTWSGNTASGNPRNAKEYRNEIVSIRVQGNTASVETELYWPEIYYYDFLTLIKVEGSWKIVHKSWWEKPL
ncbi:nuclear transport factor 2 family protein [Algoriphagus hitonicola]|uniref:Putative lumazine-binding n=1 Tax=Algoriphagus hitonicola TaxID=435880 RepID=A0A1I2VXD1_9BACT|nr:nuclear transport factor 2 family protein [Algoriphagus hitonicola]SFG93835.1 Putative lumazine-binding [Algoriphagus hitonicola]